jgi:glutaconyl-CoA/methylmalonyl-CoA decarboxylase subunit gamma
MKMLVTVEGVQYEVDVQILDDDAGTAPTPAATPAPTPASAAAPAASQRGARASAGPGQVTAPLAGTVLKVLVKVGDTISANDPVVVLEAMKMESNISADAGGTVSEVCVKEGDSVQPGKVLVRLS